VKPLTAAALFAGLLALTLAAYAPVFHAGYVWDDDAWLTGNPAIADPGGLHTLWTSVPRMQYYPLTFTSFWIEYRLWGLEPLGYHLVNVFLHACNAFLLGLVLRTLKIPGAFWAAALFAVHPVHVESVAWVTERKNVLSGLFFLGSALAYLEFAATKRRGLYAAALALFACALLAKTAAATLPLALAIVIAWRRWPPAAREFVPLAPFFALAAILGSITVALEKGMVGIVGSDFGFDTSQRLLIACRALLFYPYKLLVPYPLIFNYPRFDVESTSPAALWPLVAMMLAVIGLILLWRRGGRGIASGVLVYAVTIFPALGFFDVYAFRFSFVADHFQYLASIGILVLIPAAGLWLLDRIGERWKSAARALGAAGIAGLALLTWNQAGAYRDEATLWRDTLRKNPDSWIAHHNLATLRSRSGDLPGAIAEFDEALRCKPMSAESFTGRGYAYGKEGRIDKALGDLDRAIELDPTFPQAYLNRGELLLAAGRFEDAIADLDRFLANNPGYAIAYRNRAMARMQLGQARGALDDLSSAIQLDPKSAELYTRRGAVQLRLGRSDAALQDFDAAIRLDPKLAATYLLRGGLYKRLDGNSVRACADWQQACNLGDCRMHETECKR